ncbi:MAG: hypothetical protein QXF45_04950 [Candidatus Caldarchaeum sp.]
MSDDADYWIIKIPKPRKILRIFAKIGLFMGNVFSRSFSVDVPLILITSLLVGVVLFIMFTVVFRIPDFVAAVFTALLILLYLLVLRREMGR